MAQGILFDKSCRGYDRKQVNAFILELNHTYQEQLAEKNDRISSLESTSADQTAALDALCDEKKALEEALAKERDEIIALRSQLDEMASSLREIHASYNALKQSLEEEKKYRADKDGAVEVFAAKRADLIKSAKDRFDHVVAARNKILSKLISERIVISKEELVKLVDRLSGDAAEFYLSFTEEERRDDIYTLPDAVKF